MAIFRTMIAALALLVATPALAEERITNFISDVRVGADGTLDVVETISLVSEGAEIQRGIQRDFPTRYPGAHGGKVEVGFTVVGVQRDGKPEPYSLIGMRNGERVRIGDADTLLTPGDHVYRIHYRTTRQLGFYGDFDELYWNATGNGWTFPIERAEARITLPVAVPFGKRAVYPGEQGATGHDAVVASEQPGRIVFRTTRRLEPAEGLTVAAAWRKGVVAEPDASTRLGWWLRENGGTMVALAGLLAILVHCARSLWRARRNPDPRPIVPLFSPPDDLSAAAMRYIWRMGSDDRTFAAAIVDAAVRGRLRIVETSKGRRPDRLIEKVDGDAPLPRAEDDMADRLFKYETSVPLKQANYEVLIAAQDKLDGALNATYGEDRYFSAEPKEKLRGWTAVFGLLLLVALVLTMSGSSASPWMGIGIAAVIVIGIGGVILLSRLRKTMPKAHSGRHLLTWIGSVLLFLLLFQACGALVIMALMSGNPLPLLAPLVAIPVVMVTRAFMIVPTGQGWALRNRILGFRQYLSVTEEDRLDTLNPPEKTAALFERYLPYAMALDVENRWAKRFTGILSAAAIDTTVNQGINQDSGWYVGGTQPWSDPGGFASTIGKSLTSTISSAATAPGSSGSSSSGGSSSSSSGSSGGGSSGGGGGGGWGSGW